MFSRIYLERSPFIEGANERDAYLNKHDSLY